MNDKEMDILSYYKSISLKPNGEIVVRYSPEPNDQSENELQVTLYSTLHPDLEQTTDANGRRQIVESENGNPCEFLEDEEGVLLAGDNALYGLASFSSIEELEAWLSEEATKTNEQIDYEY